MRLGLLPEFDTRVITVKTELKGAFENEMEELVSRLEEPLSLIGSIENIISVSEMEKGTIWLYFTERCRMDSAYISVRDCVNRVYSSFPENIQRPALSRNSGNDFPVFMASFDKKLFKGGKYLKREFESMEGAGEIETAGENSMELDIRIDAEALINTSLKPDDIRSEIAFSNSGGTITPGNMIPVKVDCLIKSKKNIADIIIIPPLRIKDAGDVAFQPAGFESEGRINGKDSFILYVMKADNANTIKLCRALEKKTHQTGGTVVFSRGREIEKALSETAVSVFSGIVFVILTTFIFIGDLKLSMLASANPVFSAVTAASAAVMSGFEINIIVLAGIAVCTGLSIDNAIIYTDTYKKSPCGGKRSVSRKLLSPLLFSALTTAVVFLPLFFTQERIKNMFMPLALTIAAGLSGSLVFTFIFMPSFLPEKNSIPVNRGKKDIHNKIIKEAVFFACSHKKYIIPLFIIISAMDFLIVKNHDFIFFSRDEGKNLSFILEYESGINFRHIKNTASELEMELLNLNCMDVTSRYERGKAGFDIKLNSYRDREQVKKRILKLSGKINSAYCYFPGSPEIRNSYDIDIYGKDLPGTASAAETLAEIIKCGNPDSEIIYHFKSPVPVCSIILDTAKCSLLSITPEEVFDYLYMSLTSPVISKYYEDGTETDIRFGISCSGNMGIEDIMEMSLKNRSGNIIQIKNIASCVKDEAPGRIYHKNRQRCLSISVKNGRKKDIDKILQDTVFQEGYRADAGSEYKKLKNSGKELFHLAGASLLFIYIVLAVYFESYYIPALIIFQIPSSLFIPLIILKLLNIPFSIISFSGLLLTAGISVNNMIILLPPSNIQGNGQLLSPCQISEKLSDVCKPVLMASATTLLSTLPLAAAGCAEGNFFLPLSVTLSAGIAGSLLFLPICAASCTSCAGSAGGNAR